MSLKWCITRTELFMYFCIMNYIGTKVEVYRQLKIFLSPLPSPAPPHPPRVVYATDRSKAVVSVLFLILRSLVVYTKGRLKF